MNHYKNQEEIEAVVSGFEECTTAKDAFKHRSHLTVACYYLRTSTIEEAVTKMRAGLFRFLDHHGIDRAKYDEELTRNWFHLVQSVMQRAKSEDSLVTITNVVMDDLSNAQMIKRSAPSPEESN